MYVSATDEYIDSGFLALQHSLDRAFIEQTADRSIDTFDVGFSFLFLFVLSICI